MKPRCRCDDCDCHGDCPPKYVHFRQSNGEYKWDRCNIKWYEAIDEGYHYDKEYFTLVKFDRTISIIIYLVILAVVITVGIIVKFNLLVWILTAIGLAVFTGLWFGPLDFVKLHIKKLEEIDAKIV